jgi:hypothetical protein
MVRRAKGGLLMNSLDHIHNVKDLVTVLVSAVHNKDFIDHEELGNVLYFQVQLPLEKHIDSICEELRTLKQQNREFLFQNVKLRKELEALKAKPKKKAKKK